MYVQTTEKRVNADKVAFEFKKETHPVKVTCTDVPGFTHVIMPMHVNR